MRARRAGGNWSHWVHLHAHGDHAPDGTAAERATDPVWTGPADELQLRARRRPARPVRVALVSLPAAARALVGAQAAAAVHSAQAGGQPAIVPRAAWGGDRVIPRAAPVFGTVEIGVVHHTENANTYGASESAGIVLAIAQYHRDVKGWNDIGYNFLVDRFGTIFEGRAGGVTLPVIGAHAQGFNRLSTGVSVIGSFMDVQAPQVAVAAVARLLAWKLPLQRSARHRTGRRRLRRRLAHAVALRHERDAGPHLRPSRRGQHRLPRHAVLRPAAGTARADGLAGGTRRRAAHGLARRPGRGRLRRSGALHRGPHRRDQGPPGGAGRPDREAGTRRRLEGDRPRRDRLRRRVRPQRGMDAARSGARRRAAGHLAARRRRDHPARDRAGRRRPRRARRRRHAAGDGAPGRHRLRRRRAPQRRALAACRGDRRQGPPGLRRPAPPGEGRAATG